MAHCTGHLRDAFYAWIDAAWVLGMHGDDRWPDEAEVEVDYEQTTWPARKLLGRMCHCTDIMPSHVCDQLEMPPGTTCAAAAQRLLREMAAPSAAPVAE